MKLLEKDRNNGRVKILIENDDDLWHLKDFITEGDLVSAKTQRTKLEGREKKTLTLQLRAEKTEYTGSRLRVTGEITQGSDDIELGYHTFNLEEDKEFTLKRDFTNSDWEKLEEMEEKRSYKVLFCIVEKGNADFYVVEESGISDLSSIDMNIPGKMYASDMTGESFHNEVKKVLERSAEKMDYVILAGPGNEKDKIMNLLSEETSSKVMKQNTSVTGKTGLNEAIKRGALKKVVENSRIADETEIAEEFFEELRDDGNVSYGDEVEELVELGAVEKLLISAEKNRKKPELKKKVEQQGGEAVIIHTDHEAGERLEQFGGMAAILRYKP